jgi:hypothetical protein
MERDPGAKKEGYSANSYIWALEDGLIETTSLASYSSRIARGFI